MSFSGRVDRESHEGGLLISFEGRPPRLGARLRVRGGKILGKVDTVLGPIGSALIHVHPLYDGIDGRASVGSPVEIAPRENSRKGGRRGSFGRGRRDSRDNKKGGHSGGRGRRDSRDNKKGGHSGGRGRRDSRDNKKGGYSGRGGDPRRRGGKGNQRSSSRSGRRPHGPSRRRGGSGESRGKRR